MGLTHIYGEVVLEEGLSVFLRTELQVIGLSGLLIHVVHDEEVFYHLHLQQLLCPIVS